MSNPESPPEKPWAILGISRKQYAAVRPWRKAGMTKERYAELLELIPHEACRFGRTRWLRGIDFSPYNDNLRLDYGLYSWRTAEQQELDFVLYGEKGLVAIEVKRAALIRQRDLGGLRAFIKDYPMARAYVFYGGNQRRYLKNIELVPLKQALPALPELLGGK